MKRRPPRLRVEPADEPRLALQARALAAAEAEAAGGDGPALLSVVAFTLGGVRCAVDTRAVERVVTRLGATAAVPQAGGGARLVAWVDEQPVAVTDLLALAGLPSRPAAALAPAPALLVATRAGPVALAVEGPLALDDDRLALGAGAALEGAAGLGLEGRLAGGAALVSATWLLARAAEASST